MTRLNHTGRARVKKESIDLGVEEVDGAGILNFEVRLDEYGFSPRAQVFLEARRQTTFMRFDLGTVASVRSLTNEELTAFGPNTAVTFTLKVVSTAADHAGRVLGLAKGLRPSRSAEERDRQGILPFKPTEDLGARVWRLDLSGDEPIVLINRSVGDWFGFARSPEFCALVYPEIVRLIALWEADNDPEDDSGPWRKFLRGYGFDPVNAPEEPEPRQLWADDVTGSFCMHKDIIAKVVEGDEE